MTKKVYKSAQGKTVDLGALILQNEQVRAVGNMNVNARGDLLDSSDRVIDQRNRQVQRQYNRQTNVENMPVASSNLSARKAQNQQVSESNPLDLDKQQPESNNIDGLAGAMARSRSNKKTN